MRKNNLRKLFVYGCFGGIIIGMLGSMYGCTNNRHAVIAVTGTNIGVEISQNPANQSPQAKLGYQRSEVAIVPSNRSGGCRTRWYRYRRTWSVRCGRRLNGIKVF